MQEKKGKETVIVDSKTGVDEEKNRGGKDGLGTSLIKEAKELEPTEALRKIIEQIKRNE